MGLSDHLKFWGKSEEPEKKTPREPDKTPPPAPPPSPAVTPPAPPPATPPPAPDAKPASPTLEELSRLIAEERKEGEGQAQAITREIEAVRLSLEKLEVSAKTRRDQTQQQLEYLQQDAEREIKFLERKLQEDLVYYNKQLSEREKALEQTTRQIESGHLEKKTNFDQSMDAQKESLNRAEQLLKEQEIKLTEERAKWRELLEGKEAELLTLRHELHRRDADLQKELEQHDTQRKAAQELWQTRLKDLERQSAEKRKAWEEGMKAKEEERGRLQTSLQERQATWQMEQEKRLQEMTRRQERATDKMAALKAHLIKETQTWQQQSQAREEQIQQLKVKLLLSESDGKGRLEQAQKKFQMSVHAIAALVQDLQTQIQSEQHQWKKAMDEKDAEMASIQDNIRAKLRALESDYAKRLGALQTEKESLNGQFVTLQEQYKEEQSRYTERMEQLRVQQEAMESQHQAHLTEIQMRGSAETQALEAQIVSLEKQKADGEHDLEALRAHWQDELRLKDQALKDAAATIGPQEAELRKRFTAEEEAYNRQSDALKTRVRSLERDLIRTREAAERAEKEHAAAVLALQKDHDEKEAALHKRATDQEQRLSKRLEERRLALDAFLAMKKDEETRIQSVLQAKDAELTDWGQKLDRLPIDLQQALDEKKKATETESESLRGRIAGLEGELTRTREEAKSVLQRKATELSALRQRLETQHKELSSAFKSQEQVLESERAQVEKQLTQAQGEMDRVRSHWQLEIERKEAEVSALQEQLRVQLAGNAQAISEEAERLQLSLQPLEDQRRTLSSTLERDRADAEAALNKTAQEQAALERQLQDQQEKAQAERVALEARFRAERESWSARRAQLELEAKRSLESDQALLAQRTAEIETLEAQHRAHIVAHDARRRELEHSATQKARTLQELIDQMERELRDSQERFPIELKAREERLAQLQHDVVRHQDEHAKAMARFERAMATLARRGHDKEEHLRQSLASLTEDVTQRKAARDVELATLQADVAAKEAERQGELDRLAKQFAEERFQLEKAKEDIEWKLKDHKDISERQLAGRQKEILLIESELARAKTERDQQIAQRSSAFDSEKQKLQATHAQLQRQLEDLRRAGEAALSAKRNEIQELSESSKKKLQILDEEFNQKVGSWRATNDAIKTQIAQAKTEWQDAQDHWETVRKEKDTEIQALRRELGEWESRIQNDLQMHERTLDAERQTIYSQLHKAEKNLTEFKAELQRKLDDQDAAGQMSIQEIESQEQAAERQWAQTLEQWQLDKQQLQMEKERLEHATAELHARVEHEVRQMDETAAQLRMDIAFRESESVNQRERLRQAMEKEMAPLHDRLGDIAMQNDQERAAAEARLRIKDDELRNLRARLSVRDKRVQDEIKRRSKEVESLRRQLNHEADLVRRRFDGEKERLELLLSERRTALALLENRDKTLRESNRLDLQKAQEQLQTERAQIEENIRTLNLQRDEMHRRYARLLGDTDKNIQQTQADLDARETEMTAVRDSSRHAADELRKRIEQLRHVQETQALQSGPTNAAAWSAFERGIGYYQNQQWAEAVHSFEECLSKDPRWGAAYQYLALAHHALGHVTEAAAAATQALQQDPENKPLLEWADQLRDPNRFKKAS